MVIINISGSNTVYLTLAERATVSDPEYLFEAVSKSTNKKVSFALDVTSSNNRYDICSIDGTLFKAAQYVYQVYQIQDNKLIETGLLTAFDPSVVSGWDAQTEYNKMDDEQRGQRQ